MNRSRKAPARGLAFKRRLLKWFRNQGRDLPWRRTREPYEVLVSEFMLQQTQVNRVIDYYDRFLRRFPTVESLRLRIKNVCPQSTRTSSVSFVERFIPNWGKEPNLTGVFTRRPPRSFHRIGILHGNSIRASWILAH